MEEENNDFGGMSYFPQFSRGNVEMLVNFAGFVEIMLFLWLYIDMFIFVYTTSE